jgi:hypothetical protein
MTALAARLAFLLGVLLTVAVAPWTFMKATGAWGQELSFEPSALVVGVGILLFTWAAFMACYLTHSRTRKA